MARLETPILDLFGKPPYLTEPRVWIRRIVIYETLGKKAIQDFKLEPGLNIIKTTSPTVKKRRSPKGTVKGHGAGKTTLCRMIRYLLGESVFGTAIEMERIRTAFPVGYVAAELFINGRLWSVMRPLGPEKNSYVAEGKTIEELSKADDVAVPSNPKYVEALGLSRLVSRVTLRNGEPISWAHLLPWFTRDEGANFRFQHSWREPSSESDSPDLTAADTFFLIRSALGFTETAEIEVQKTLDEGKKQKNRVEKEITTFVQTAEILARHYRSVLQDLLEKAGIDTVNYTFLTRFDTDDSLFPVQKAVNEAKKRLDEEIQILQGDLDSVKHDFRQLAFDTLDVNEELERLQKGDKVLDDQQKEILSEIATIQDRIKAIDQDDCHTCRMMPKFLLKDCQHIKDNRSTIFSSAISEIDRQNKSHEKIKTKKRNLTDELKTTQQRMAELEERSKKANENIGQFSGQLKEKNELKNQIEKVFAELQKRYGILEYPASDNEYSRLVRRQKKAEKKISKSNGQIQELNIRSTSGRKLIKEIFNQCVQLAFDEKIYAGRIIDSPQRMKFFITYNNGEKTSATFDVFSTLLADTAALIYNSASKQSSLPGLVVYDSPKKYDMEPGLYDAFFFLLLHLQDEFQTVNTCPFQFIITTTTPPPDECRSMVRLELDASIKGDKGLLLKRNVVLPISSSMSYQGRLF